MKEHYMKQMNSENKKEILYILMVPFHILTLGLQ